MFASCVVGTCNILQQYVGEFFHNGRGHIVLYTCLPVRIPYKVCDLYSLISSLQITLMMQYAFRLYGFHPCVFRAPILLAEGSPPPTLGQSGVEAHAARVSPRGAPPSAAPVQQVSSVTATNHFIVLMTRVVSCSFGFQNSSQTDSRSSRNPTAQQQRSGARTKETTTHNTATAPTPTPASSSSTKDHNCLLL